MGALSCFLLEPGVAVRPPEWECPESPRGLAGREGALPCGESKGTIERGGQSWRRDLKAKVLELFCNRIPQEI